MNRYSDVDATNANITKAAVSNCACGGGYTLLYVEMNPCDSLPMLSIILPRHPNELKSAPKAKTTQLFAEVELDAGGSLSFISMSSSVVSFFRTTLMSDIFISRSMCSPSSPATASSSASFICPSSNIFSSIEPFVINLITSTSRF